MTRREVAFLLIGLGFGLMLSLMVVLAILLSLYRNFLITSYGWDKAAIVLPVLLLAAGITLLMYKSRK